jgi:ribosomal protein S18 acetylase RimI-like enzyme
MELLMFFEHLQGLVKKRTLTASDVTMIKQLAEVCERYEHLYMRIDVMMLQYRSGSVTNDFLYYENNLLVGYLALDDRISVQYEVVGMVHPDYRRQGIFRTLLDAAVEEGRARNVQQFVLVNEQGSRSGHAFVRSSGAVLSESEHEMFLMRMPRRAYFDERLVVHEAEQQDIESIVQVQSQSFNDSEDTTRARILQCMQYPEQSYFLAVFGDSPVDCHEPVGSFRLDNNDTFVGIYAFGVCPDYQGRGYGRQMLEDAIHIIRARSQKAIMLDVDVENNRAIHLYRSCGFEIRTTYNYYVLELQMGSENRREAPWV